jgi:hypothetical protein
MLRYTRECLSWVLACLLVLIGVLLAPILLTLSLGKPAGIFLVRHSAKRQYNGDGQNTGDPTLHLQHKPSAAGGAPRHESAE